MKDHEWSEQPICPHCGYKFKDAWEWQDSGETECPECEKKFFFERNLIVRWVTKSISVIILFILSAYAEVELPPNPPGFRLVAINPVVKESLTTQTNDAPVRRWHGAMVAPTQPQQIPLTGGSVTFVTTNLISVNGVVDIEELSRAVAFRRATIPPPPMPPSTNTNESATMRAMNTPYRETAAQRAQRMWFEHGGQKGRPTPKIEGRQ